MSHLCILVLIGLPGAGKTCLCQFLLRNFKEKINVLHVSYDELTSEIKYDVYKHLRNSVFNKVESNVKRLLTNSEEQWIILIDDNMYYKSMRREYYNLAKKYEIGYCQVQVSCNIETAIYRNNNRHLKLKVASGVIYNMEKKLEAPSMSETWERHSCNINSEQPYGEDTLKELWSVIKLAMKFPAQNQITKIIALETQVTNQLHDADLILRKLVNNKIAKFSIEEINSHGIDIVAMSKQLANKKKDILNSVRTGELIFPKTCSVEQIKLLLENLMN